MDLGDTGRSSDKDNLVDVVPLHLGISDCLLNTLSGLSEEIDVQFLEPGLGESGVEVNALVQGIDLDGGLGRGRQGPLCPFAGCSQSSKGPLVVGHVHLVFSLEFVFEVVNHPVVEVFATKMGVSVGRFDLQLYILSTIL